MPMALSPRRKACFTTRRRCCPESASVGVKLPRRIVAFLVCLLGMFCSAPKRTCGGTPLQVADPAQRCALYTMPCASGHLRPPSPPVDGRPRLAESRAWRRPRMGVEEGRSSLECIGLRLSFLRGCAGCNMPWRQDNLAIAGLLERGRGSALYKARGARDAPESADVSCRTMKRLRSARHQATVVEAWTTQKMPLKLPTRASVPTSATSITPRMGATKGLQVRPLQSRAKRSSSACCRSSEMLGRACGSCAFGYFSIGTGAIKDCAKCDPEKRAVMYARRCLDPLHSSRGARVTGRTSSSSL